MVAWSPSLSRCHVMIAIFPMVVLSNHSRMSVKKLGKSDRKMRRLRLFVCEILRLTILERVGMVLLINFSHRHCSVFYRRGECLQIWLWCLYVCIFHH